MNKKIRKLLLTSASTIALLGAYPSIATSVNGLSSPVMTVEATTTKSSLFVVEVKALPSISAINSMNQSQFSQTKRNIQSARRSYENLSASELANNEVQRWEDYLTQKEFAVGIYFVRAAAALPSVGQIKASDAYAIQGVRADYENLPIVAQRDIEVQRWESYLYQKEDALGTDFIRTTKSLPSVGAITASNEPAIRAARTAHQNLSLRTQANTEVQRWEGYLAQKEAALPFNHLFLEEARALASVSALNRMGIVEFNQARAEIQNVRTIYNNLPEEIKANSEVMRWEGYLTAKEDTVGITFVNQAYALPSVNEINNVLNANALAGSLDEVKAIRISYDNLSNVAKANNDVTRWEGYLKSKEQAIIERLAVIENDQATLATIKDTAKLELRSYVDATNYKKSAEALASAIEDGIKAIDSANTIEAIYEAQSVAQTMIDAIETDAIILEREAAQALAAAKETAKTELQVYVDSANYERNAESLTKAIANGLAAIDSAKTITEVKSAQIAAQAIIDAIETDATITEREAVVLANAILEAEAAIRALPAIAELTINDANKIVAARELVDIVKGLNQEAVVTGEENLKAAELKLNEIRTRDHLTFDSKTGTITGYDVEGGRDVVIPATIDGIPVTSIGRDAFNGKLITSVVIPDSVTTIGRYAFSDNLLQHVEIPKGVTKIEYAAFNRNLLESIVIPEGVTQIEDYAFVGNQLSSISLPDSLVSIGDSAFSRNLITEVVIPNSVRTIGSSAFYTNKLKSVVLPDGLTEIARSVFSDNNLTSVTIPDSVIRIERSAFSRNNLTEVKLNEGLISIEPFVFSNNNLSRVVLPNTLISVGENAFLGSYIRNITIGSNVVLGESSMGHYDTLFRSTYMDPTTGGPGQYINGANRTWEKQN